MKTETLKVQVTLNKSMIERVDEYANRIGMSRSSLCALAIGQYMDNVARTNDMLSMFKNEVSSDIKTMMLNGSVQ